MQRLIRIVIAWACCAGLAAAQTTLTPEDARDQAIAGATHILLSHGHGDHSGDTLAIAKELSIPAVGIYDLMSFWEDSAGIATVGFNKGGTVKLGDVEVTMVAATHSSSYTSQDGSARYTGAEVGYMIAGEGRCVYLSGDTDVMADMAIWNDLHSPDVGILCAGGHYTMDMKRAAYAASKLFSFKTVIPYHYKTFPALAQSADPLKAALPGVSVHDPEVMVPIDL